METNKAPVQEQSAEKKEFGEYIEVDINQMPTTVITESGPYFETAIMAVILDAKYVENTKPKIDNYEKEYKVGAVKLTLSTKYNGKIVEFEQRLSGLYNYGESLRVGKKSVYREFTTKFKDLFLKEYSDDIKIFLEKLPGKKVSVKTVKETVGSNEYTRHQILNFFPSEGDQ